MSNVYGLILSVIYIGLVLFIAQLFTKAGKEASRKFIHIMLSNWWIIAMVFFDNVIIACILPAIFVVINYLSYKFNIIKVMERDSSDDDSNSLGTVYYAVSLLVVAILTFGILNNPTLGLIGIAVMGYGDGFAAIAGKGIKSKHYKVFGSDKSIAGSISMFLISLIIISGGMAYMNATLWIIKSIIVAIIATVLEAASPKGTDNLTVPIATTLLVWLMSV